LTGPGANGFEPTHADMSLWNMNGSAPPNDHLPLSLDVSDRAAPTSTYFLTWDQFFVNDLGLGATNRIRGTWTGGIQVPEPSTVLLFAMALGLLAVGTHRQSRTLYHFGKRGVTGLPRVPPR
jgi:hypothetical protein